MPYYVTKWALTRGILEIADEDVILGKGSIRWEPRGVEWHRTRDEAEARFLEIKTQRVSALRRQLERFENARSIIVKVGQRVGHDKG